MIESVVGTGAGLSGIEEETFGVSGKLDRNGGVKEEIEKREVEVVEPAKA